MARNYGRISTSIWRDPDFLDLSPEARFTYTMLVTQPNVSPCGILELTERRWARALGYARETLTKALDELTTRNYVVVDEDTEELLIRTFIKWDGGANNDLRRKAITEAAGAIASPSIAHAIAPELARAGLSNPPPSPPDGPSNGHRSPVDTRRVVVTKEGKNPNPQPATINPQPSTPGGEPQPLDALGADPPDDTCPKHPAGTDQPCGPCATARKRRERWDRDEPRRRRAAERLRANCPDCHGTGWTEHDDGTPAGHCTHHRSTA